MALADRVAAAAPTRRRELVDTPEWADLLDGEAVYARSLNAVQRAAFMDGMVVSQGPNGPEGTANTSVLVPFVTDLIVDKDGRPIFELAHRDMLSNDHPDVVSRVIATAVELTDFGAESAKN